MPLTDTAKTPYKKALHLALALFLSVSLVLSGSASAYAEVRKDDTILGSTVDSRGLAVLQCPDVVAEYALIMDEDGTVYFERNAASQTAIASVTKIMTALVAIELAPLDTVINVSSRAASVGESSAELQTGDSLTLDQALIGLMVSSGNDAAIAIAETLGKSILVEQGNENPSDDEGLAAFVAKMNTHAAELGMNDSEFSNPHGLDFDAWASNQHSTANDVAIMSKAAMQNETLRSITSMEKAEITVTAESGQTYTNSFENTNELLSTYEGVIGIKTGFTDLAESCLASAVERDGVRLYAIVLYSSTSDTRFSDAENLYKWAFEHRISYNLINVTEWLPKSDISDQTNDEGVSLGTPVVAEVSYADRVNQTVKATVADANQAVVVFDLNGNVSQKVEYEEVSGEVKPGDKVGTLTFMQRNEVITEVDLIACEEVEAPGFFEGIGIWWDRLFKGFTGGPKVAESQLMNDTPLIVDKTSD